MEQIKQIEITNEIKEKTIKKLVLNEIMNINNCDNFKDLQYILFKNQICLTEIYSFFNEIYDFNEIEYENDIVEIYEYKIPEYLSYEYWTYNDIYEYTKVLNAKYGDILDELDYKYSFSEDEDFKMKIEAEMEIVEDVIKISDNIINKLKKEVY